jgi:hypothetical protein
MDVVLELLCGVGDLLAVVHRWRFATCLLAGLGVLAVLARGAEGVSVPGVLLCGGLILTGIVWEWRFGRNAA